jgi:hypothetical protein
MIKSKLPKFYRMEAKCIFFNFFELEIIRREINEDLENFFNSKIKNLMFATSAKVYAYMNQIVSVRIILAKFSKIPLEDIEEPDEVADYKEWLKTLDGEALIEEEVDSDEEEEPPKQENPPGNNSPKKNEKSGVINTKEIHTIKVENKK